MHVIFHSTCIFSPPKIANVTSLYMSRRVFLLKIFTFERRNIQQCQINETWHVYQSFISFTFFFVQKHSTEIQSEENKFWLPAKVPT